MQKATMISQTKHQCFKLTIMFLIMQTSIIATNGEAKTLILPLKSQTLLQGPPSTKLHFHHNISLTVSITVGTPPQTVSMVIDTGSELSWLQCNNTNTNPVFHPTSSSSYLSIPCSSPTCTTKSRDLPAPTSCDSNNLCHAAVSYADGSSSEGVLASDTFGIGGSNYPSIAFGCMNSTFSSNPDGDSNTIGLLGLNLGSLSLVSQLELPKFSYCISGGNDFSGVLILGESNSASPLSYTPLVRISDPLPYYDRTAYTVRLTGIKVSDKLLNIPNTVFVPDHTGAGQTMLDLGTQFTFLLGQAYSVLRNEYLSQTNGTLQVDTNFVYQMAMDLCYRVPKNQLVKFSELPSVSLVFEGVEMKILGEQLLYLVPNHVEGDDAVYCFTFGNSDLLGVEAFIIGHYQQQNMLVEFDLANSRVGMAHAQCDSVGERLLGLGN